MPESNKAVARQLVRVLLLASVLLSVATPAKTSVPPSKIVAIVFIHQIIAGAHGEREDRQGWILTGTRHEGGAVGDEHILRIPALIKLVEHRGLRITPHARRA